MEEGGNNDITTRHSVELLERILEAVERDQRKRWVEILCAMILAMATAASAWCAYQSNLWGGVQTFKLAAAAQSARDAGRYEAEAFDARMFDTIMLMHFVERRGTGEKQLEDFLYGRFRPEMKAAVDAWLATDPFNNPNAPHSPFKMAEYVQPERLESQRLHDLSVAMGEAAGRANELSDQYVLLTVLFAMVLFFGGISATISNEARRVRWGMQILALVLFIGFSAYLLSMPLCHE